VVKKVLLIGNLSNSQKHSMLCYEKDLFFNLKKAKHNFKLELYQPKPWFKKNNKLKILLQYIIQIYLKKDIDLYHITDHSLLFIIPFLKNKTITTVHDLIPIVNEKKINQKKSFFYKNLNFFLKKNIFLIARSEATRKDLTKIFDLKSKNIKVIYNGLSNNFKKIKKNKKHLQKKYLLNSSNKKILIFLNPFYKNNLFSLKIIKHYEENFEENLDLVCIGSSYDSFKSKLNEYKLKSNVYFFKNLKNYSMNEIYNLCNCLLFPSINEGFGSPPIEAMKIGIPVMCSNIKIFKETIGWGYPLYKLKVNIFARNLRLLLHNTRVKKEMVDKGYKIAKKYRMHYQIRRHLNLYNQITK